jgi:hypothetical protein
VERAGEAGNFMLGNTVGPAGGADIGHFEPVGVCCRFVSIGIGLGLFVFSLSSSWDSELSSDRAVDGALSTCSPLPFSESSDPVVVLLVVLLLLRVLLAVLVRLRTDLPVCGGEAMLGETSDMPLRKSR